MSVQAQKTLYPHGLPHRPPEALAVALGRLRRWTVVLIAVTLLAVGSVCGAGIYFVKRMARQAEIPRPVPAADGKSSGKADADPTSEHVLEALGRLTASHLYQSYLSIGLLADGFDSDVYSRAEAEKLLETITTILSGVDGQLARVGDSKLSVEDREALERCQAVALLIRAQMKHLRSYWKTGDQAQAQKYQEKRDEAWKGIKELLDIEE